MTLVTLLYGDQQEMLEDEKISGNDIYLCYTILKIQHIRVSRYPWQCYLGIRGSVIGIRGSVI
jgi:hypothetical protein